MVMPALLRQPLEGCNIWLMLVRLAHWRAEASDPLVRAIREAGYEVEYDPGADAGSVYRAVRRRPPDLIAIDLSRLPSHGRELAIALRGAKSTRRLPIIFIGGAPEKVESVRAQLPDAIFTGPERLGAALAEAIANTPASPVVPPQMMERYAGRTVAQKLGILEGSSVAVIDAPRDYATAIGDLPSGVRFDEETCDNCAVTLWFVQDVDGYRSRLRRMRSVARQTKLWIVWPKKAARSTSGLSEQVIREAAMALGLVDYKICAVDRKWSAMAFAIKRQGG